MRKTALIRYTDTDFILEAKKPLYLTSFRLYAVRAVQTSTEFTRGEDNNGNRLLEMFLLNAV